MSQLDDILPLKDQVPILRLKENLVWGQDNDYVSVHNDDVIMPNGRKGKYIRIVEGQGKPGVVMVPITESGKILLVNVYRYPTASWSLEFPRGFGECEDSLDDVRRECLEETGRSVHDWKKLGSLSVNAGILATMASVYGVTVSEQEVEHDDEVDSVHEFSLKDLQTSIHQGIIDDSMTVSAFHLALSNNWITSN